VTGDAAWLDGVWAELSYPADPSPTSDNGRIQTAWARHDNMVNVLYADGHSSASLPSRLTWGLFWGIYGPSPALPNGESWNSAISTVTLDSEVWSTLPE
jgi:prepilin-type processing-associated H-X9-DG protein